MGVSDTSVEAARCQVEIHRRMGGPARFRTAMEMSQLARAFVEARIRKQQPNLSQQEMLKTLVQELYGYTGIWPDERPSGQSLENQTAKLKMPLG